ncbi:glycosyl hydrolase, family 92 protein [Cordyceps militaris CM01]|uniref:Glycosyl hydrolase, family 92 protein n=1 Tax=Cordyceps militaris (strain CM01) TaxID=983644 RepID=G3JDG1_CORMM|nr:glycosyl hydrolase, family 92 protein [Cordyceps militaris CM01]EGX92636.1 glycosyl hydrolase, family 92 protein [Cordyceps militaris CM01]
MGHQRISPPHDPLAHVDPLIGSQAGGNVFAGATLPYGLAKAVADVDGQNTGGFGSDGSNVTGFSAAHDSGTGGNPSLGNFPLFPQLCRDDVLDGCLYRLDERKVHYVNESVRAAPGRFAIGLASGIHADMTVSEHAALYRFTFPEGDVPGAHPHLMLDLTDLWKSRQNASIRVDADTGRMTGNGTFLPSFGAGSYVMHFCVDFFGAPVHDTGVWVNSRAGTEPKTLYVTRGFNLFYVEAGGWVRFAPQDGASRTVTARVGLSFKSSEQACHSAETEIGRPLEDFDRLVGEAQDKWREKLSPIRIKSGGASEDLQKSFWSGAYRNMIAPQNYTGENPHWDTGRPYFDSFYCIWDAFRVQHPFLTVVDPAAQAQMVQTLLDMYQHDGWLPDCHMSLCRGWTQGGSNADVVLADAFHKNLSSSSGGTIDWDLALRAVLADAEDEPLEWSVHGRGGLRSWKALGYIPYLDYDPYGFGTNSRSVSRTLEYAYDDYCVATLAGGLGRRDLEDKYLRRSTNWVRLWKADQRSSINGSDTGFAGFFQPRYANGTWGYQDPIACSALAGFCSLTTNPSETFEASIWQYLFYVPHSAAALIDLVGGDDTFIHRLDYFHTVGLADISNEPVFLTVFMYHYAGRPALSARRLHTYIPSSFNATPGGLPGNDDSGAMGSFLFFSVLGFFPVAGQNVYLITPPFFQEISITSPQTGKTATVRIRNFDPAYTNLYVQRVTVNGKLWTRSWIGHELFTEGWTLEMELGEEESDWGSRMEDRPPSFAFQM